MKIKITTKVAFDDRLGKLTKGQEVELPDHKALFYIRHGMAVEYLAKVVDETPAIKVEKKGRKKNLRDPE